MSPKLRLPGAGGKQLRPSRSRGQLSESEGEHIASSTASPASSASPAPSAHEERDPAAYAEAYLREAAARIAASLTGKSTARSRARARGESPAITEHVVVGRAVYSVRGELLEQRSRVPVVLVVAERDPDAFPSYDELLATYRLTRTEARVAILLAERLPNREIARELHVTLHTARRHTERVLRKLGTTGRSAVRRELLRCARKNEMAASDAERGVESSGATAAHAAAGERAGREAKGSIVVLLSGERDRRAIIGALHGETEIHFAARPRDLRAPWPDGAPIAVMVELPREPASALDVALKRLRRTEPTIPVWAYIHMELGSVREFARLSALGLVTNVVTAHDDLATRMRTLLKESRASSESATLWRVWKRGIEPEAREIVAACIDVSARTTTVRDVARQLNRSLRTLRWQVSRMALPAVHRILYLCRLLRAMHRLDQHGSEVKTIAKDLGYPSAHALAQQLHRRTGLHLSDTREGNHFAALAEYVSAELSALKDRRAEDANVAGQRAVRRGLERSGSGGRRSKHGGAT